jgi:hypothetical protein
MEVSTMEMQQKNAGRPLALLILPLLLMPFLASGTVIVNPDGVPVAIDSTSGASLLFQDSATTLNFGSGIFMHEEIWEDATKQYNLFQIYNTGAQSVTSISFSSTYFYQLALTALTSLPAGSNFSATSIGGGTITGTDASSKLTLVFQTPIGPGSVGTPSNGPTIEMSSTTGTRFVAGAGIYGEVQFTGASASVSGPGFASPVPEPGTFVLIGFSLLGLGFVRRRRVRV